MGKFCLPLRYLIWVVRNNHETSDLQQTLVFNFDQYNGKDVYRISFIYSSDFINPYYNKILVIVKQRIISMLDLFFDCFV